MEPQSTQDGIVWVKPENIGENIDLKVLGLREETLRLAEKNREKIGHTLVYYAHFMAVQLARFLSRKYKGKNILASDCEMALLPDLVRDTRTALTLTFRVSIDVGYQEYWDVTLAKKPDGMIDNTVPVKLKDFTAEFAKAETRRARSGGATLGGRTPVLS
ncbi:hypothetical protein HZA43_04125 [Candidatus Peregrinibacteria bacterium]|nr:hypothetical protein [Candidatus Peregrinibacteria bacterium]